MRTSLERRLQPSLPRSRAAEGHAAVAGRDGVERIEPCTTTPARTATSGVASGNQSSATHTEMSHMLLFVTPEIEPRRGKVPEPRYVPSSM